MPSRSGQNYDSERQANPWQFPFSRNSMSTLRTQNVDVVSVTGHCTLCGHFHPKGLGNFPLIVLRVFFHLLKTVYLA